MNHIKKFEWLKSTGNVPDGHIFIFIVDLSSNKVGNLSFA